MAEPKELFTCLQHLFCDQEPGLKLSLDDVLALFTINPARRLKLSHKGRVRFVVDQHAPLADALTCSAQMHLRAHLCVLDQATSNYLNSCFVKVA